VITFQFFDGCPNAQATLGNLRSVLEELKIPESELELIEVPDPSLAEKAHFQGSPTILLEGRDLVTGEEPVGFNYTCRIYSFGGNQTGVIPRKFIKAKLLGHRSPTA